MECISPLLRRGRGATALRAPILAGFVALSALSACSSLVRATADRDLAVEHVAGSELVVESRNGSIEVVVEPGRTEVQVDAVVQARAKTAALAKDRVEEIEVHATRGEDGVLFIHPVFPEEARGGEGCSMVVKVGEVAGVEIRTSNGKVVVSGASGAVVVRTSNGRVDVFGGDSADVTSSNGNVLVQEVRGAIDVETSNAGVELEGVASRAKVRTSNGRIRFAARSDYRSPFDLKTSNANVDVELSGLPSGRVEVQTSNGSITAEGADEVEGSKRSKTVLFGEGAEQCKVKTSNGNVRLTRTS